MLDTDVRINTCKQTSKGQFTLCAMRNNYPKVFVREIRNAFYSELSIWQLPAISSANSAISSAKIADPSIAACADALVPVLYLRNFCISKCKASAI